MARNLLHPEQLCRDVRLTFAFAFRLLPGFFDQK